jgi:hypothetical protein
MTFPLSGVSLMDLANYQRLAGRTAAPITPEVARRFLQYQSEIVGLLRSLRNYASRIDEFKAFVFYGKKVASLPPPWPLTAVAEQTLADGVPPQTVQIIDMMHGLMGVLSEMGAEVFPAMMQSDCRGFRHTFTNDPKERLDTINIREECGDAVWFICRILSAIDEDFLRTLLLNILKLEVRFPDKFSEEAGIIRDLKAEREQLERSA